MTAKVLIVEDEAPLAEMLRYNLESEGFRVSHAVTGEDAEMLVAEERPDPVESEIGQIESRRASFRARGE
jgi:two-component system phosphate regulon response regulator PhoB